ncbi:putative large distal tail fiber subunit [Cronobacter phage vB_CsaM_SemperBestia]|uniref:Long tail fiber protein Gp37 n=1 Tax=Cronobacter phage vB_CsaM_SemperBestia TaxID=2777353 RepID=A0A7T3TLS1_9CAUD|nr:putative large distal tail fiber subunit [Cronobacter phage vB_CsaM_SemperBestia]
MADLKAGTTVGGNTIWSQANLPLLPSGNTITYKGFKIYTENDKPTKAEIGLGNVTNDAQVKKAGDDMTGSLNITGQNSQLTVPYRLLMQRAVAGDPYVLFVRPDNNPTTVGYPSNTLRVMTITARAATTADPVSGAQLANVLADQTAQGNGALTLQAFAAPNTTTGASGQRTAEIYLNGNGQVSMTGTQFNIGMQTVVSGTMFAQQMSIKGDGNKNLYFQDAGGNELGLIYADTGKNLYVRTGGGAYTTRFASDGTLVLANHLTVPGQATFNGQGVFNNRASVGVDYDSQGINSAILRVETNGDGNAVGDGVTHLGYKDSNGRYNHYFRGTGVTYINTKLGLNVNVPSYYNDVPQGTPAQYFLPTVGQGGKNYLRQFRGGNADTIWHETVQGGVWRLATGSTDGQEELQISTAGYARFRNEVQSATSGSGGQFRAVQGNYGFFIRNDGGSTYFMLTNSGDPYGSWNGLRPLTINNGTGQVSIGTPLVVTHYSGLTVTSTAGDAISWGNAGACLANDGNLKGSRWKAFGGADWAGDALSWVNNNNVAKSGDTMSGGLTIQANGGALRLNATASNQSVYVLGQRAGVNGFYMGFGGSGTDLTLHNYILDTNINLRASDISFSRTVYGNGDANFNNVYIRSDITLKRNFKKIENALDKVDKLDGLIYEKKNSPTSTEYESVEAGIIAQSLQEILPEAVVEKEGVLNVSASGTIALLVNAIKELKARVEYLESK